MDHIRNFCIIAHIDHGKSTLADRLIQRCGRCCSTPSTTPTAAPSCWCASSGGTLRAGTRVRLMRSGAEHRVEEVGCQCLRRVPAGSLEAGEVGYVLPEGVPYRPGQRPPSC